MIPGTLTKLARDPFTNCNFLEKVWVEQRCQIDIANYVQRRANIQFFRAGDEIPLSSIRNSAGNGK